MSRLKSKFLIAALLIAAGLISYLSTHTKYDSEIIKQFESGESVVSVTHSWLGFIYHLKDEEVPFYDEKSRNHEIELIEYRGKDGKILASFAPYNFPTQVANAAITADHVLISTGFVPECPELKIFKKVTGEEVPLLTPEFDQISKDAINSVDPCMFRKLE